MDEALLTLSMGLCLALAAVFMGIDQILHSPQAINYPTSKLGPLLIMFAWCVGLTFRAFNLLYGVAAGAPEHFPPSAIPATILLTMGQGALLYTTLRQWLPAKVWRRIRQLIELATCGRVKALEMRRRVDGRAVAPGVKVAMPPASVAQTALVELQLGGVRAVAGPNEGPAVVRDSFSDQLAEAFPPVTHGLEDILPEAWLTKP